MIKILGIIILFAVCSVFGFYKANLLYLRQKRILNICLFIEGAADRIRVGEELSKIVTDIGEKAGIYKDGFKLSLKKDNLQLSDINLAHSFLDGLGMGDTASQLKRCETYGELLKKEYTMAEEKTKEKAALYKKLGLFTGLLISIVLV